MSKTPYILLIAPQAPPNTGPEALQVRRMLAALDGRACGRLVTVAASQHGWNAQDASLALPLTQFDRQELRLPLHALTSCVLTSHRLKALHQPDSYFWLPFLAGRVAQHLPHQPDIIYSRSSPMSAALLARKLKQKLGVPWLMHLSDPWADSPYKTPNARDAALEAQCFAAADHITLTTESQAQHYRSKYPAFAHKISVSPNVMDANPASITSPPTDERLHIVHAGNLYGDRSPAPLIAALHWLRAHQPETLNQLHIDFYGNAQAEAQALLHSVADVIQYHGPVCFAEAYHAQAAADLVLSIEPDTGHPLGTAFLPSKVVDCLALGKPLLALTPTGSETEKICNEGYGWALSPRAPETIAKTLIELVGKLPQLRSTPAKAPPARYSAAAVTDDLLMQLNQLLGT